MNAAPPTVAATGVFWGESGLRWYFGTARQSSFERVPSLNVVKSTSVHGRQAIEPARGWYVPLLPIKVWTYASAWWWWWRWGVTALDACCEALLACCERQFGSRSERTGNAYTSN